MNAMQFVIKLVLTVCIIVACVQISKRLPSLAGLIATMPLTGLIVLVWISTETQEKPDVLYEYTRGAVWGIIPSILFYITAMICFGRNMSLSVTLGLSFAVWLAGAFIHQMVLG